MPRRREEIIESLMLEHVARIASGLEEAEKLDIPTLSGHYLEAVKNVGLRLRTMKNGLLVCAFCTERRGTFTPRGYYFHLLRSHRSDILELVRSEASRIAAASRASEPSRS